MDYVGLYPHFEKAVCKKGVLFASYFLHGVIKKYLQPQEIRTSQIIFLVGVVLNINKLFRLKLPTAYIFAI